MQEDTTMVIWYYSLIGKEEGMQEGEGGGIGGRHNTLILNEDTLKISIGISKL